ncbi:MULTISPECIES: hypothetical protein [unclassified Methylobacterium]|jgi:hypothetical protein|uniref:hypothetical protein n=1 Tax=unclassified Methylobacterium TaxID=2615210 RepID=UPI001352C816|nr:hypothetical protein [Methylobacterium sp. 2A]MWV24211.1 hypothetical protein [Methylobacterium sp. 2A]
MSWVALSPGALGLRLVMASALIALLCVCAWRPGRGTGSRAGGLSAALELTTGFKPTAQIESVPAPVRAALFDLAEPGIDPVRVTAGIDPRTGLREDVLSRGNVAVTEAPALRVTLTRGREANAATSLFILMARRAAAGPAFDRPALAVIRTGSHGRIQTKFGAVDTLEITFGNPAPRTCLGFVTRDTGFRLDGWSCAPLGQPPAAEALACSLDALSLVDLADPETTAAFSTAAPASRSCPLTKVADASGRNGPAGQKSRNKK